MNESPLDSWPAFMTRLCRPAALAKIFEDVGYARPRDLLAAESAKDLLEDVKVPEQAGLVRTAYKLVADILPGEDKRPATNTNQLAIGSQPSAIATSITTFPPISRSTLDDLEGMSLTSDLETKLVKKETLRDVDIQWLVRALCK